MSLNTHGRCEYCDAVVRNAPHKRYSKERLTAIHDESCPGQLRKQAS